MDQNQTPSFEIPKSPEATSLYSGGAEFDPSLAVEGTREILPAPHVQQPLTQPMPQTHVSSVTPGTTTQPMPISTQPSLDAHLIADDVDVMEKEWVDRAKK